jgi:type IV pilus assembly protein PilA
VSEAVSEAPPLSVESCTPGTKVPSDTADNLVGALVQTIRQKTSESKEENVMFSLIHKRMKSEKGFTLIELLVVIIIIAILAAIAIPTFLGQRNKAYDAAAKSLVRNAMTAMETIYVDGRDFQDADATSLPLIEPAITWAAGAATAYVDETTVGYTTPSADTYTINSFSKSGKEFAVSVDKLSAGIVYTPAKW